MKTGVIKRYNAKFKAKHCISIPVEGTWYKINKGEVVYGRNVDGIVSLYLKPNTKDEAIALFKISDVMFHFDIT